MDSIITSSKFDKDIRDQFKAIKLNLKNKGFPFKDTVRCLVTNNKYIASDRELKLLVNLLNKETNIDTNKLKPLVYGCFHDYLGQKISRFSFEFTRSNNKLKFIDLLEKQLGYTSQKKIEKNIEQGYASKITM